jgi:plastocyanin
VGGKVTTADLLRSAVSVALPFGHVPLILVFVKVFTKSVTSRFGDGAATMRNSSLVAGLAIVLAACGGGDNKGTADQQAGTDTSAAPAASTPAATTPTAAGATHDVNMELQGSSYKFVPEQLTIKPNDVIRYHNKSGGPHNVAFWTDSIPSGASSAITVPEPMAPLSSKLVVAPDEVIEVKFNNAPAGDYKYYCTPHLALGMKAKLTVKQ